MIDKTLAKVAVGIVLLGTVLVLAIGCATDCAPVPGPASKPTSKPAVLERVKGCHGCCEAPR